MKNFFLFLLLALVLGAPSCGTVRPLPSSDSSRVEVRIEREFRTDTVYLQIPEISDRVVVLDTISVLENRYAKSMAYVSAGTLSHSLHTKPVREPVAVQQEIIYRDSLVFQDHIIEKEVPVERPLSSWERFKLATGGYFCLGSILLLILSLSLFIIHLKTFKL